MRAPGGLATVCQPLPSFRSCSIVWPMRDGGGAFDAFDGTCRLEYASRHPERKRTFSETRRLARMHDPVALPLAPVGRCHRAPTPDRTG